MNLTKLTADLNAHQNLPAQPSMSSNELKAAWDKPADDIKTYINSTLTEEITAQIATDIASSLASAKDYTDQQIAGIDLSAENVSYDNTQSHMAADNVQEAVDEVRSNITSVNSAVTNLGTRVTNLENGTGTSHTGSATTISNGTKDYEETIKQNGLVHLFLNVKSSNVGTGKIVVGTLASGYRPSTNIKRKVNCGSNDGGGSSWFSDLYLNTGGTIQIDNQTSFKVNEYNFDITFSVI